MRRDDDQVGAMLCSSLIDSGGAVSSNSKRVDPDPVEIDLLQKSLHPIATSAPRGLQIRRRIVIAAGRCHHNRTEIRDVQDDEARTEFLSEFERVLRPGSEQPEKSMGTMMLRIRRCCARARELEAIFIAKVSK